MPETLLTVIAVKLVDWLMLVLLKVQLPVELVTQLLVPPGTKFPLTVAFATPAPELMSRIDTVTLAFQFFPVLVDFPLSDLTATTALGCSAGEPAASEKAKRFFEPVPMLLRRSAVAFAVRNAATEAGDASGLAASTNAATPVTWGDAMEVPLLMLVAVALLFQAEVMYVPGAKISTQVP